MGAPLVFCAGANIRDLPGKYINYMLVNVVDNLATDSLAEETDKMLKCANSINEIYDSGGFSLLMAEEKGQKIIHDKTKPINYEGAFNFTPHHVVDVVRKQRPHEFVAADFPVRKLSDPSQQETEYIKKKRINVPWAKETSKLRQEYCPEVGLLIALQGYNLNHVEDIYLSLDGIEFDGISMPVRNMSLSEIALIMLRSWQLGIDRFHLLGVTEFFTLALASYMARNFMKQVSLDSRTWKIRATYNTYLNPHDLIGEELGNNVIINKSIKMDCVCPWCKGRSFNYIKNLPYYDRRILLGCHNLWVTEKAAIDLYENSGSVVELERYLKLHARRTKKIEELITTLGLIDLFRDSNIWHLQNMLS
jgi:hypothetical protein